MSNQINSLINKYYKNNRDQKRGRHYNPNNFMNEKYNKSYEYLKYLTITLGEFPSIEEWNQYAQKTNCLNSQSMQYISRNELA